MSRLSCFSLPSLGSLACSLHAHSHCSLITSLQGGVQRGQGA
jgi:hypothetical protein